MNYKRKLKKCFQEMELGDRALSIYIKKLHDGICQKILKQNQKNQNIANKHEKQYLICEESEFFWIYLRKIIILMDVMKSSIF